MSQFISLVETWVEHLGMLPVLMLLLFSAPLVALAWWHRIFPHRPLVLLLLAPCILALALFWRVDALPAILAVDLAVAAIAAWDLFSLPRAASFSAERQCQRIASLRKDHRVTLTVTNRGQRDQWLTVRDDVPESFLPIRGKFSIHLPGQSRSVLRYELRATRRGAYRMQRVYLRVRSRLGLWQAYIQCPVTTVVHVYPDMKQLAEYAVLARTNRLSLMGLRRTRRIGQDNEFERLRDYTIDDNYRHIDWRSTARRRRLTVKEYQSSQSQRLVFLIDCGRMMTNEAAGMSLLDHSLNAMLMLGLVALRKGDSVGMIAFSDRIDSFVPPRGGMNQLNHLLHASFNRFPRLVESRYDQAFLYLATHCRKRSLVVLVTNVIDEVNSHQIQQYLSSLAGRHLPLGVMLRDHQLFDAADAGLGRADQPYRAAAAADILIWRHQVLRDMAHQGVLALDVFPEEMTAPLVNRYLEIKARHLL